ncbi:F-box domain [Arabidopsis thaliana x Arabidopsis arenosa]|uniref:F-box domain n=1 Tax=Arabidopsis thaliana x Arabidopsis arenosa TaxID=1240361 RepID=A0A8T2A7A4_9BRAS|nr:F-box domain [Arabidopsis thaliana x Arabidopsis arenosa]
MSSKMPDWSQLPVELLHLIPKNLEDEDYCFDVVHARSVFRSWRSLFPFPSYLLRQSYSLPSFADFPLENKDLCTLKKVPLFLFRLRAPPASAALLSKYFLGGIGRDESEDHMELQSPLQCSVKVKIRGSEPTLINILDYQIIPLGYQYRMIGSDHEKWIKYFRGVVFLPLNKEGEGGEFVVLLNYSDILLVLTSAEMRWKRLTNVPDYQCMDLVTFRGRFYAAFLTGKIVVIDPYSLEVTPLMPLQPLRSSDHLIPSGNDELFLVEHFNPFPEADELDFSKLACRVSRLDEEAGKWVEVSDLGDRVLFIGHFGNVCCSAKELPDGCGVSGNSILFTNIGNVTFAYKYGVQTGRAEDVFNTWRSSTQNRVTILSTSPVLALRLEC